ncbi:MAG: aminotransferase class I/II-fold pyridoxal phosphate-dependent enzyme [Clostridia bacterium]|nr:aminotransferase class I/II-fold pyridoxal phosphate-dependent enzyme [Clostridia bacterium]
MEPLITLERAELEREYSQALSEYERFKSLGLKLDMSRGKPSNAQLDLSMELASMAFTAQECVSAGVEARNYGAIDGLPACKELFADILGVKPNQVFCGGNASLTLMYDTITKAYTHGLLHSPRPWHELGQLKFLCPVPGYDRHFAICEAYGIEMIPVPMTDYGPDMDVVERLIADPAVKGMWCVPKFSNPSGIVYSNETIARIAAMKPAAPDFVLMWDNAYCIHEIEGEYIDIPDILELCERHGNADMVFEFCSTSKVTFPGSGVACFACSEANMAYMKKLLSAQVISYDKMNQLRHVRFLRNREGALAHMKKHAAILADKFDVVISLLDERVAPLGIASYHRPKGGYFISLYVMRGCAKRVHQLMKDAGIVMTSAGATFPYGLDPEDSNLRLAPSFPPVDELRQATEALCCCIKLAALEKLLAR